jgi:alcohol dehydrogenase
MSVEFGLNTPVLFGAGCADQLGEICKMHGGTKVMLVCDPNLGDATYQRLFKSLEGAGLEYVFFNKTKQDAPVEIVNEVGNIAKENGCDCFVGVGGGSTLDTCKGASILAHNPGPADQYILADPITVDVHVPVILMPTTAGTGSEGTRVAVISIKDNGNDMKWSVFIQLAHTIIDPELTYTLPPYETAYTGMDALAHAIEGITAIEENPLSHAVGLDAIRLISRYLLRAYHNPNDLEARTAMAKAAWEGGVAFDGPLTHCGHATADGLSTFFHTPHGVNCALAIPECAALIGGAIPERIKEVAEAFEIPMTGGETGEQLGNMIADKCRAMMMEMRIPSVRQLGHGREEMLKVSTETETSHLSAGCPVKMTHEIAVDLAYKVYDNYPGPENPWVDKSAEVKD